VLGPLFRWRAQSWAGRYGLALAGFFVSLLLRAALAQWLHSERDFVVCIPAILLIAFIAGRGPAIVTALLSGLSLWYFYLPPIYSFRLEIDSAVDLATFAFASAVGIASLGLHELATNAAKYGSLSNATGRVAVSWKIARRDKQDILKFSWQERGGLRAAAPTRQGFGTSLINKVFADVRLDYAAEGLSCEFDVPLGAPPRIGAETWPPLKVRADRQVISRGDPGNLSQPAVAVDRLK
jgi:Domain of unknown function (DUF4118)